MKSYAILPWKLISMKRKMGRFFPYESGDLTDEY